MDTLAADGLVRAERVSKDVEARNCPYKIPSKWAWVRLATVLPFRDPLVLAKECATLDYLSGGRLLPAQLI